MLKFPNLATVLWSGGLPRWLSSKEPTCDAGATGVMGANPGAGHPLEEGMATHTSVLILAW